MEAVQSLVDQYRKQIHDVFSNIVSTVKHRIMALQGPVQKKKKAKVRVARHKSRRGPSRRRYRQKKNRRNQL